MSHFLNIIAFVSLFLYATGHQQLIASTNPITPDSITISPADSATKQQTVLNDNTAFKPRQLILPLSLMAVGTFGVYNGAFHKLNNHVKDGMDHLRGKYCEIDNYVQYLPVAAYLGLGFAGVKGKHPFRERLAAGITAYIAFSAINNAEKYIIKEQRPDSGARNSFPSGHTGTAFTGAELVRLEYGTISGIAAYTVATGIAFMRLYNGRHWLNDVIGGAGLGILSARIGYWMLPLYRRWFHWDSNDTTAPVMALAPGYDVWNRAVSMNFVCTF